MIEKLTPLEKEWRQFLKREQRQLKRIEKAKDPFWEKKLKGLVPKKLKDTLEASFLKGFKTVLNSGTGILEKTFSKDKLQAEYKIREYAQEIRYTRKNLAAVKRAAGKHTAINVAGAGAEGAALGLLGIGLPDIVLFLGILLRSLYTLALHYGVDYENEEEKDLLLDLLTISLSHGKDGLEADALMNRRLYRMVRGEGQIKRTEDPDASVRRASEALAKELLYLKFLQGIPVIGVIGGVYDGIYLKKITEYVSLKLERRYLLSKMEQERPQP